MKLGVVLSGGGSKGAYEIGVWKALRKLNVKYDIVTGTSVGALNAALMTQKTFHSALNLWQNLEFEDVLDETIDTSKKGNVLKAYAKGIRNGGMKINKLENTVEEALNLKKIYRSNIDMGIVTVKASNLKPILLTKKEIDPLDMKDYLIASASCYPAFKKKNIDDIEYIDGGVFDNLPINLAISMGAEEIIAVDLKEVGIKRRVKNQNIKITTISPRNNIGSFLVFDSKEANRAIQLGFNDTMKTFGKLDGNLYTFQKGQITNFYLQLKEKWKQYENKKITEKSLLKTIEKLGTIFEMNEEPIYTMYHFNKILKKRFLEFKDNLEFEKILTEKNLKEFISSKAIVQYIYYLLDKDQSKTKNLIKIFSQEYECAIYLKIILGENL